MDDAFALTCDMRRVLTTHMGFVQRVDEHPAIMEDPKLPANSESVIC